MPQYLLEHFDALYRYVARRISDVDQIHTIVRQTFSDALHYADINEKTPPDRVLVNLYKIAYNHLLALPQAKPRLFGPRSAAIQKTLDQLDHEDQEIIRLKFWEEVLDRDIATIVGLNPRRIEVRILQATKRFKEHWQDSPDYPEGQYFSSIASAFITAKVEQAITPDNTLRENLQSELAPLGTEKKVPSQSPLTTFARVIWYIRIPIIVGVIVLLAYQFNIFQSLLPQNNTPPQIIGDKTPQDQMPQMSGHIENEQDDQGNDKIEVFSGEGKYIKPAPKPQQPQQEASKKEKTEQQTEQTPAEQSTPKTLPPPIVAYEYPTYTKTFPGRYVMPLGTTYYYPNDYPQQDFYLQQNNYAQPYSYDYELQNCLRNIELNIQDRCFIVLNESEWTEYIDKTTILKMHVRDFIRVEALPPVTIKILEPEFGYSYWYSY